MEREALDARRDLPCNNQDYASNYGSSGSTSSATLTPTVIEQKDGGESTAYCQSGYQSQYLANALETARCQQRYQEAVYGQQTHHSAGRSVQSIVHRERINELAHPEQPTQQALYCHDNLQYRFNSQYQTSSENTHATFFGQVIVPETMASTNTQTAYQCRTGSYTTHSRLPVDTTPTGQENSRANRGESTGKVCRVCGDVARSYHFGGLSCDSCKAFFRRSVQNNAYINFQCFHTGNCVVTASNRKSCQHCRMKRCFEIGMEKSWVMTEEERKTLMKERSQKKLSKQLAAAAAIPKQPAQIESHVSDLSEYCYVPDVNRMKDFMSELEMREIESVVTKYVHAYKQIPYRNELCTVEKERPGSQMMEMFGTLIRRFAFYARMIPDFASLPSQDQRLLLKGGVFEMCLLRGALVFDPTNNRWPNTKMSLYADAPVLELGNIALLSSQRLFQMHVDFIKQIKRLEVDEPVTMLLILIVLFTARSNLSRPDWVEKYQAYYVSLLEHYTEWRYGPARWKQVFSKLLTKLSDLRELSETHNQRNVNLGSEEILAMQQQLQYLDINPYPELEIMPSADNPPSFQRIAQEQLERSVQGGSQKSHLVSHQHQKLPLPFPQSTCTSVLETSHKNTLPRSHSFNSPFQHHGSQVKSFSMSTTSAAASSFAYQQAYANQHMLQQQQNTQQKCESAKMTGDGSPDAEQSDGNSNFKNTTHENLETPARQCITSTSLREIQNMPPNMSSAAEMGMQFMRAMHQSVSQVIDEPHFGFEWVQPDYKFDGFEDVLKEYIDSQHQQPPMSDTDSRVKKPYGRVEPVEVASRLTPHAMEELYYELERYSELYN